ncbi:MAG: 50S ribosomal protein L13 [Bacteroidetes bacterium]|nr:50S ribosomal protein L13 [Bacteroidota bacterium]
MNTLSYKTLSAKPADIVRKWYLVNAEDVVLGRMATTVANILRGKNKPNFTPHVNTGDCVVIINAEKVKLTGKKWEDKKYLSYSGYPGGLKKISAEHLREKKPISIVEKAIKGMLPKNKLSNEIYRNLYVYAGSEHNHQGQKPTEIKI